MLVLLLAAGCTALAPPAAPEPDAGPETVPPPETTPEPAAAAAPQRPPLTAEEHATVAALLDRADRAIAEDHLTYPMAGSALDLYDRVRLLDPDNDEARRGLERIVERYLELALGAVDGRRFEQARAMLDRARLVDPDHAGIPPTEAQIDLIDGADRQVIRLDPVGLRDRTDAVADVLRQAGAASRVEGCRTEITARNDAEGRWIYQQMSSAGAQRIQARLNIGSPPAIEVLCLRR